MKRLFALLGATATALAVWVVAVPLLGVDLIVKNSSGTGTREIPVLAVALFPVVCGLLGWALLAILTRLAATARGTTIWTAIALVVLVLSMSAPLTATSTGAKITLAFMHISVGAVLIAGLRRRARAEQPG